MSARSPRGALLLLVSLTTLTALMAAPSAAKIHFVDDKFEDFAAGTLDDGGHNLYVARDGSVRTINRFDLNDDGRLDLIFNCTHNTYQMLPASGGAVDKQRAATTLDIAVEGSQHATAGDLNRDGYSDIVFCPNLIGVHHDRRFVTIAWGGPDGWPAHRINSPLPMNSAAAVELADLNADGWPDIAILGSHRWRPEQPEGRIVRIYWGSATGYSVVEFHDLGIAAAAGLAAADFDRDGARDLAVLRSDGQVQIEWSHAAPADSRWTPQPTVVRLPEGPAACLAAGDVNSDQRPDLVISMGSDVCLLTAKAERSWAEPARMPAFPATQITMADLDGDRQTDLVLTQFDQARAAGGEQAGAGANAKDVVRILWGDRGTYAADRSTGLEVQYAVATAAGDLDGDGHLDLAIAVHQGEHTFNGESQAWFGDGKRQFVRGPSGFRTAGTMHVLVVPAEQQLSARAVFSNSIGGQLDEDVPLHVYWGGENGFDPERVWKIPFHSGYEASAADLNADGHTDLIVLNSGHAGEAAHADPTLGANILWGGPGGLEQSTRRTVLHEHFLGTSSVSDLNRDGYLDLVLEPFAPEHGGKSEKLILYYGGADGFTQTRRKVLSVEGYAQEHLVADFNRDQWLDIAATTRKHDCIRIFWGGPEGFDVQREQRLKVSGPVGVDAADFNGDGWLDVLAGSYNDPVSGHRDMGLVIFWGGPDGYQHAHAQWLPGFSPLGRTIADFDGDGHLDLFSPQHSGELTREDLACHLYWGSPTGFATRRRTTLFCDSPNDSMAADFNGDGRIDLAVNCHTRHGDHRTRSKIFYNDGQRFADPRVQLLPTNGPHLIWAEDVGHLYDRTYRQAFESRPFTWTGNTTGGTITTQASRPPGTRLELSVRSAAQESDLPARKWELVADGKFTLTATDRCLQYRATFRSDNGDRFPVLQRVELALQP